MNDYWRIISLINEILTIYECETFKIDYIKHGKAREDTYDAYHEDYIDSVGIYFPDEDKPEDYERKYLPDLFICIDKNEIDIRVDKYVGAKNLDERMQGWRIELKFHDDDRLSDVIIKCIYPKNSIDFLGFKEAFNTEARKRISEMEKIVWEYSLHRLYDVDVSTQITESKDQDNEINDEVKEYAEMHIEINATTKDYKQITLSDEDIETLKEQLLKRVNKWEPPIDIDPHFGVNIDPRTGGVIDPIVIKSPHTDVNHANNDSLPDETKKEEDHKLSGMTESDQDIIKNIYVFDIDTHWAGLIELYSQPQYAGFVKSETKIECKSYFEEHGMFEEKVIFELNKKENIIHYSGYFSCVNGYTGQFDSKDPNEPQWYIDCDFDENDELEAIRPTKWLPDMVDVTHNAHVQELIKKLSENHLRKGVKYHK